MRQIVAAIIVGVLAPTWMVQAETLEEVEKKITALTAKHESLQIKMKSKSDYTVQEMNTKTVADSTSTIVRKGDKWLFRMDSNISNRSKGPQQPEETKQDMKVTQVYDGEYMYVLNEMPDNKTAMKKKPAGDEMRMFTTQELWKTMHETADLKLLPDEKVGGKSAWVIQTRPKKTRAEAQAVDSDPLADSATLTYYSKDDGVVMKVVTRDKNGKIIQSTETTDVKLNAKVDPNLFKFKAPEGVTVMDLDALQKQAGAGAGDGGNAQEPASEGNSAAEGSPKPADSEPKQKPKSERKKGIGGLLNKLK